MNPIAHAIFSSAASSAPRARPWVSMVGGLALVSMLSACAVGPDYVVPTQALGAEYKAADRPGWARAQPQDHLPRGAWWGMFNDPVLDDLMRRLAAGNQTIVQAEANYRAATALLRNTQAGLYPTVGISGGVTRSGSGARGGSRSITGPLVPAGDGSTVVTSSSGSSSSGPTNQYALQGSLSWEVDLWGQVRRAVEADEAAAQGTGATLAATRLSQQSTLAQTYFQLRVLDEQRMLYARTIASFERTLRLTQNRYDAGLSPRSDVSNAVSQLENARATQLDQTQQRELYVNAIALLLGQTPANVQVPEQAFEIAVPDIPVGVPSALLERRPDVAAAERQAAAANARIGVAQAAWFPTLTLSANAGWRSSQFAEWLTTPARYWTLAPQLAATLFDAGARRAQLEQARAQYDAQAASYRQTVLTALREVEDAMVTLDVQAQAQAVRLRALAASRDALRATRNQYDEGLIDFLDVVTVENNALTAERDALNVLQSRLVASVQLIAALGGGWDAVQLNDAPPPREAVE